MMSERRKRQAVQQLQAVEQIARHLQRLLEAGEVGEQLEVLASIGDHWQEALFEIAHQLTDFPDGHGLDQ